MTAQPLLSEPGRVDEPHGGQQYSDVLTKVTAERRPVIVCRNGSDLAAVVPLEHFELLQELLERQEAERLAGQIDWDHVAKARPPAQARFDRDEPKPF